MKKILVSISLLVAIPFCSQTSKELCAFDREQRKLEEKNAESKRRRLEAEARLLATDVQKFLKDQTSILDSKNTQDAIYEIPVVVHMMNDGTVPLKTDAEISAWIDNCNKFYATTFGGEWYTAAQGGNIIPFKLVLAKRNASCNATTGIVQVNVTATYPQYSLKGLNDNNSDGVSNDQLRALSRWDTNLFYNIYVVNTFDSVPIANLDGVQGYASLPTNPDSSFDTFMKASVVTNVADPTTLPHEFGHSLGLYHPFNTGSTTNCPSVTAGGCATDNDLVCDTPSTKSLLGVDPLPLNTSINPCDVAGWNNVQYNVMNYTSSNRLFTLGQKNRATTMFLQNRKVLTQSLGGFVPSGSTPLVGSTNCIPPSAPTTTGDFNYGPTYVKIGSIENRSEASSTSNNNKVYYDYGVYSCTSNAFKTTLSITNNPQTITLACGTNSNQFSVWIDYNNNGNFENSELIVNNQAVAPGADTNFSFSIPNVGVVLNTPLRLRVIADDGDRSSSPCGQIAYGQVEDYVVTITNNILANSELRSESSDLAIYPNPSDRGNFSIKTSSKAVLEIQIIDSSGRIVYEAKRKAESGVVSLNTELSKGHYLVSIRDNGILKNEKLIVK